VVVQDGRILATSEYYTDLVGGYGNVPALSSHAAIVDYIDQAITFVKNEVKAGRIPRSAAVDVALKTHQFDQMSERDILLIECNAFDDTFDTCLFDDLTEIRALAGTSTIVSRWRDLQGTLVTSSRSV
jgi:hypothetical protein